MIWERKAKKELQNPKELCARNQSWQRSGCVLHESENIDCGSNREEKKENMGTNKEIEISKRKKRRTGPLSYKESQHRGPSLINNSPGRTVQ